MGLISNFFRRFVNSSGPTIPVAQITTVAAGATSVHTVSRLLSASSTLSLITGTDSNLTLNATTGVITAITGLTSGTSQRALVREANGLSAIEYPITITVQDSVAPTPTPTPTPSSNAMTFNGSTVTFNGDTVTYGTSSTGGGTTPPDSSTPVANRVTFNGEGMTYKGEAVSYGSTSSSDPVTTPSGSSTVTYNGAAITYNGANLTYGN